MIDGALIKEKAVCSKCKQETKLRTWYGESQFGYYKKGKKKYCVLCAQKIKLI